MKLAPPFRPKVPHRWPEASRTLQTGTSGAEPQLGAAMREQTAGSVTKVNEVDSCSSPVPGRPCLLLVEGYAVTSGELPAGDRTSGLFPVRQRRRGGEASYEQSRTGGSTRRVPACMPTSLASKVVQSLLPQLLKGHLCCSQQGPRSVGSSWEPASQTELL